jgi:hypothetical protein
MQLEGSEDRDVTQGLEDRTVELVTKVYVTFETVVEPEVNDEVSNPLGFGNSDHCLLQWRDRVRRLALLRALRCEFRFVQLIPFKH